MPNADETTYLIKVMPDTTQDFLSRDVDLLVSQIKENLRLSSLKTKSNISHNRPSPYRIPIKSFSFSSKDLRDASSIRNNGASEHCRTIRNHYKRSTAAPENDPYELLKELLRERRLIKEAVKRVRVNLDELEISEEEDDEE